MFDKNIIQAGLKLANFIHCGMWLNDLTLSCKNLYAEMAIKFSRVSARNLTSLHNMGLKG